MDRLVKYVYLILTMNGFSLSRLNSPCGMELDNCLGILALYRYFWYWIVVGVFWHCTGGLIGVCFCIHNWFLYIILIWISNRERTI